MYNSGVSSSHLRHVLRMKEEQFGSELYCGPGNAGKESCANCAAEYGEDA